ncbi:hypothetical protein ILYODFUR_037596 [Ilyodon furcidens]|uniref:Uncharacterized protein n=1 Tax=Ilyodon furcidens TaxID=33524 RepID=A0ABV0UP73_9TELE
MFHSGDAVFRVKYRVNFGPHVGFIMYGQMLHLRCGSSQPHQSIRTLQELLQSCVSSDWQTCTVTSKNKKKWAKGIKEKNRTRPMLSLIDWCCSCSVKQSYRLHDCLLCCASVQESLQFLFWRTAR